MNGKDKLNGVKTLKVGGFLEEFEKDDIKKNIDIAVIPRVTSVSGPALIEPLARAIEGLHK